MEFLFPSSGHLPLLRKLDAAMGFFRSTGAQLSPRGRSTEEDAPTEAGEQSCEVHEDCDDKDEGRDGAPVEMKLWTFGLEVMAGLVMAFFAMKFLDPYRNERREAKKRAAELRQLLGRPLRLNEYEQLIAASVVNPKRLPISVGDVYGLEEQIEELRFQVVEAAVFEALRQSSLGSFCSRSFLDISVRTPHLDRLCRCHPYLKVCLNLGCS